VDIDVEAATAHCVDYLVGQGHRHLAYLHQDDPGFGFLERSLVGFRVACQRHGALYRTLLAGDDPAEGRSAMNRLLDQYPETSGVIAWSGKVGWGAMQAIEANKLRSPEDITVACFHDPEIGSLLPCQSAMIDIRPAEVAIRAAHLLLAILEGESPVKTQVLVPAGFITPEGTTILNIDLDGPH
jgi:DNA-binding LacI/PurR family transcriptional regulator